MSAPEQSVADDSHTESALSGEDTSATTFHQEDYEKYLEDEQSDVPFYDFAYGPEFRLGVMPKTIDEEVEEEMTPPIIREPHPLDVLSDQELLKLIEELESESKHLELENTVFENFLIKNEPNSLIGLTVILEAALKIQNPSTRESSSVGSSRRGTEASFRLSSRPTDSILKLSSMPTATITSTGDRGPKINITTKVDLVMRETEEMQNALEAFLKKSHRTKCILNAELEEIGLRLNEYKEARQYFEESVVVKGLDPLTQRIPAEKFVRYMEEWLRSAELTLEKMRLRTSTLKGQYVKVVSQLTQKLELGETLHAVDFEQLRIENQHLLKKIEQKNHHLFELKKMTGRASLVLTNQKKYLQKCIAEMDALKSAIRAKEKKIEQLDTEGEENEREALEAQDKYEHLKTYCENYRVPDVMEYVRKKAELNELKRKVKIWDRRTGIQGIALNACTRQMKGLTGSKVAHPSWYSFEYQSPESSDFSLFGEESKSSSSKNSDEEGTDRR